MDFDRRRFDGSKYNTPSSPVASMLSSSGSPLSSGVLMRTTVGVSTVNSGASSVAKSTDAHGLVSASIEATTENVLSSTKRTSFSLRSGIIMWADIAS